MRPSSSSSASTLSSKPRTGREKERPRRAVPDDHSRSGARPIREATLAINPIIFAEVSLKFDRIEDVDAALADFTSESLPYEAGFLAGEAFLLQAARWNERSPMPDFYVGAHAVVATMTLLTRDAARYRTYFPRLPLISSKA